MRSDSRLNKLPVEDVLVDTLRCDRSDIVVLKIFLKVSPQETSFPQRSPSKFGTAHNPFRCQVSNADIRVHCGEWLLSATAVNRTRRSERPFLV